LSLLTSEKFERLQPRYSTRERQSNYAVEGFREAISGR
jgi:hypothetical protein